MNLSKHWLFVCLAVNGEEMNLQMDKEKLYANVN